MKDLVELRQEIDVVDAELIELFKKRFEITEQIGEYKAQKDVKLFCPEREEEKLETLRHTLEGNRYSGYIEEMLHNLMNCAKYQQSNNIYGNKDIFLIGMPGSGKSTIGKILSIETQRELIDMDKLFSFVFGISPSVSIRTEGEGEFRRKESLLLRNISRKQDFFRTESAFPQNPKRTMCSRIISCGGGIVVRDENYEIIKRNSIVFYINRNLNSLARNGRPITAEVGVAELFRQRKEKYETWSDYTIDNNGEMEESVANIISILKSVNK